MLDKRKGFTLMELLIAAAIIGALAVFATQTFRRSASDIRVQDAKSRAKVIAMAARRMSLDHSGVSFEVNVPLSDKNLTPRNTQGTAGNTCSLINVNLQTLVDCGYLEYRKYLDPNFEFKFNSAGQVCVKINPEGSKVFGSAGDEFCTNGDTDMGTGAFQ